MFEKFSHIYVVGFFPYSFFICRDNTKNNFYINNVDIATAAKRRKLKHSSFGKTDKENLTQRLTQVEKSICAQVDR